ncbi:dynamin family protein [Paraburkholderia fynbosensis]|uniref:GTPase Era n=1 Tax=Paraburkholderia fynbosensis TaxID=1200993 RepID=A0A6J5FWD0_9BURK|nr:dynamin family protein [Paraburkholderia fynbosensis]CAB3786222.1 GTPase Era [Paraburkholderia fynbosensis]
MNKIEIIHNPFIVDTQFLANGQPPAEGCKLSSYKEMRLQVWVEKLFDELSVLFNGDKRFDVTFTGVESDFLDVAAAAEVANAGGMQVNVSWKEIDSSEVRLEKIRGLMDEAAEHPEFKLFISENEEAKRSFDEAFNKDFDVYVVATMSSGKSTLINAMLGRDLLPAANEATTATIARITDNDSMKQRFTAQRLGARGQVLASSENVTAETIKDWNTSADTKLIDIQGNIEGIEERAYVRLVLTDTPGPNNSQDEEHQRTTMGFVQDSRRNPLILYVLNASQLGTNDDKHLLGLVAETMRKGGKQSKDRFIFVINKMDVFDPENGEDPASVLTRVRQYLSSNGIQNPTIYPISANLARLIRKPSDGHTRKERNDYKSMADLFSEEPRMDMLQYMPITSRVRRNLEEKNLSSLLLGSGLPAVEAMIDEYIDKYNFPHRVKRAYDALTKAIEVGLNETGLIEQLDQDEATLRRVEGEIAVLKARQEKGFETDAYRDKVQAEGMALPPLVEARLVELEASVAPMIRAMERGFQRTALVTEAEAMVGNAEETLRFEYKKLINEYEALFASSQHLIGEELQKNYARYIQALFAGTQDLNLPVLEGIRKKMVDISLNLTLQRDDIKERRVVKSQREESDSRWYNPFSWTRKKTVNVYGDEEYVDLGEFWKERLTQIETAFTGLIRAARTEIESGKDKLTNRFVEYMNNEFESKFNELLDSLRGKIGERKERELALEEARLLHDWIRSFKSRLDQTLAV